MPGAAEPGSGNAGSPGAAGGEEVGPPGRVPAITAVRPGRQGGAQQPAQTGDLAPRHRRGAARAGVEGGASCPPISPSGAAARSARISAWRGLRWRGRPSRDASAPPSRRRRSRRAAGAASPSSDAHTRKPPVPGSSSARKARLPAGTPRRRPPGSPHGCRASRSGRPSPPAPSASRRPSAGGRGGRGGGCTPPAAARRRARAPGGATRSPPPPPRSPAPGCGGGPSGTAPSGPRCRAGGRCGARRSGWPGARPRVDGRVVVLAENTWTG